MIIFTETEIMEFEKCLTQYGKRVTQGALGTIFFKFGGLNPDLWIVQKLFKNRQIFEASTLLFIWFVEWHSGWITVGIVLRDALLTETSD